MTKLRFLSLTLLLGALFAAGLTFADGTPAGESIINQASATYQDADGNELTETSDPVTTIVSQVYSFTVEPDNGNAPTGTDPDADNNYALNADAANTVTQLAGGQVVFEYTVTNSGNGDDTIALTADQAATGEDGSADSFDLTGVTVYVDDNGTPGLQTGAGGDSVVAGGGTIDLAADASATVYVVGTVPGTTAANGVALLDLTATGSDPAPSAGPPQSNIDNNNIAQVTVVDDASLTLDKDATFSGGTITYTVSGSNVGAQPADPITGEITVDGAARDAIVIRDTLPTATSSGAVLTFSSVTSFAPATATVVYSDDDGATWTATAPAAADVDAVALVIETSIGVGASYEMVFTMTTDGDEVAGDTVDNDAEIAYEDSTNTRQTQGATDTLTIAPAPDVAIGPNDDADANGAADSGDGTPDGTGGQSYTSTSGDTIYYGTNTTTYAADNQYVERVAQGDTVHFTNTVNNPGNETTRYRLTLGGASTLPAGYSVTFYRASDTSVAITEIVLDPDESANIVAAITVPANATAATVNYTAIVNATRVVGGAGGTLDAGVTDSTTNIIGAIFAPAAVDLQNEEVGTQPNGTPTDATQTYNVEIDPADTAATTLDIPLTVTNNGTDNDSYTLTEALTDLPAGTTVAYYVDENNDGAFDAGDTLIAGPTPTVAVNGGASEDLVAVITFPVGSGSAGGSTDFTATSTNDPAQSDTVTDIVNVNVPALSLINDESTTVRSPDQVVFEHTLTNSGDVAFTDLDIVPTPPAGSQYTYTVYVDLDDSGDVSAGDFQLYDGATGSTYTPGTAFGVGDDLDILVVVDVPAGLTAGYSEATVITATGTTAAGSTATSTVTDTVTVTPANLDVEKTARTCADAACATELSATGATAEPGNFIEYTITAENVGTVDTFLTEVKDTIPSFVTVTSVSVATTLSGTRTGTVYYGEDGGSGCAGYTTTVPTSATLVSGETLCVALETSTTSGAGTIDTADDLLPGESIEITLVVQVQ